MDGSSANSPRLVTFAPAIDSELSRWLLDSHGVKFVEQPGELLWSVARAGWQGSAAIPFLVQGKDVLAGPRAISGRYDRLAASVSSAQIEAAWNDYNQALGFAVARFVYSFILADAKLGVPLLTARLPAGERHWARLSYPVVRRVLLSTLGINAQAVAKAREEIERVTTTVEATLIDGRPFLLGATFSLADVLFCTSAAPLMLWPDYRGVLPAIEDVPAPLREAAQAYRQRPAGRYVARVYGAQRGNAS